MLALLLAMGGASAQGPTTVFEVDFSSNPPTATTGSMWINGSTTYPGTVKIHNNTDQINIIMLGIYNYSDNKYLPIKPETGSFQTGDTLLIAMCYNNSDTRTAAADIYADNGTTLLFTTAPGINGRTESGDPVVEKFVLEQDADSLLIGRSSSATTNTYVTTLKVLRPAGGGAIKLTPDATGKVWTLDETPDYDLDLNVVYYQKYALKEIPANWQVKVDGVDKTAAIDGDSLKITETAQVLLTPDHPERVKKVILVDEAVLVNIDGITLDITGCTTWAEIIARNPGVIRDDVGWIGSNHQGYLVKNGATVFTSDPYDPAQQSNYHWQLQ